VSVDVTFLEFVPYFSPQVSISISEIFPTPPTVSLPIPASIVSSPVLPVETQDPPATKPIRDFRYVYTHRPKVPAFELVPVIPSPVEGPPPPSASPSDLDILIAPRKGKRSCTDHPILNFVSYDHLNPTFRQFALSLSSEPILRSYIKALLLPTWKQVMDEEMEALTFRETWEVVSAPTDTIVIGCRWVFTLKYHPDGSQARGQMLYSDIWHRLF